SLRRALLLPRGRHALPLRRRQGLLVQPARLSGEPPAGPGAGALVEAGAADGPDGDADLPRGRAARGAGGGPEVSREIPSSRHTRPADEVTARACPGRVGLCPGRPPRPSVRMLVQRSSLPGSCSLLPPGPRNTAVPHDRVRRSWLWPRRKAFLPCTRADEP